MELKTKYQYTYFIYPYQICKKNYTNYLTYLLRDNRCKARIFDKEKDNDIYAYFLPSVRKYLFPSFELTKGKIQQLEKMPIETRAAILSQFPCNILEYPIQENIQGKIEKEDGIFFRIQKLELVCFQNGTCFLVMKTNIEDSENFEDVLNFNCRFKDFSVKGSSLSQYDNIKIQTNSFGNMQDLGTFIQKITRDGNQEGNLEMDGNELYTYSYACIDQENWNETKDFEEIEHAFYKFRNVLPGSNTTNFERKEEQQVSKWKYAKVGYSKAGTCLFASSRDTFNYTKLPFFYETIYLYTYLLRLYQKRYLNALGTTKGQDIAKPLLSFTEEIYIQEITNDDTGNLLSKEWKTELGIEETYAEVKNKYDLFYKEKNIEKVQRTNRVMVWLLSISMIVNIINLIIAFIS